MHVAVCPTISPSHTVVGFTCIICHVNDFYMKFNLKLTFHIFFACYSNVVIFIFGAPHYENLNQICSYISVRPNKCMMIKQMYSFDVLIQFI